jgi:two-component sensor histidine kinase
VTGQIKVRGSEIQLEPATAQILALAFHELLTNSTKFGALSAESGRISIAWEIQEDDVLALIWEESGGPVVHKPASRGFGTRSVIASIESQLGGQALFDWRSEGLICRLLVPLASQIAASELNDQKSSRCVEQRRRQPTSDMSPRRNN